MRFVLLLMVLTSATVVTSFSWQNLLARAPMSGGASPEAAAIIQKVYGDKTSNARKKASLLVSALELER